uniref:Uncharacterized protein n=1 Tax=Rhodosorus marinus TaxID=101924 RepID=A0A7S2ZES9_9RHOD|mmetsp:Transcript_16664/g.68234  ORF Transcript_16664/g.68234 Transcript_16664/m.68234 type:complete len:330 (+) Transcript_16664:154-1143(+)
MAVDAEKVDLSSTDAELDVEDQKESNKWVSRGFLTAVGLFILWSYLVMNEGAMRAFRFSDPQPGPFSQSLLLVSACGEILFGLAGVLVGGALILVKAGNKMITTAWMALAFVLGWFVFVVWVLAAPINDLVNDRQVPAAYSLTLPQYDCVRVFALLAGLSWCFALQGGQFMIGNVVRTHQADGKSQGSAYSKKRLLLWSINLTLGGLYFIIGGSVVRAYMGPGPYDPPVVEEPMLIVYPELTITAGVFHLLAGVFGCVVGLTRKWFTPCIAMVAFTWVLSLATIVWPQSYLGGFPGGTTLLAGLTLTLCGNVAYSCSEFAQAIQEEKEE